MTEHKAILVPSFITRDFIKSHEHDYVFLYSCCLDIEKYTGQAAEVLDSNCYGIPVRFRMCKSSGYFQDNAFDHIRNYIDKRIAQFDWAYYTHHKGKPIIPFPNIGEGGSRLMGCAPKLYAYIRGLIDERKYPNIVYTKPEANVSELEYKGASTEI